MYRYISVYPYTRISTYISIHIVTHTAIQTDIHTNSRMYGYMTDRNLGYQSTIPELMCQKHAQTHFFALCGITPLFCFVLCKLCFCTYSARTSAVPTKTNLPRNSPAPVEQVCTRVGKRSQLPFSPAKRTISPQGDDTSINL